MAGKSNYLEDAILNNIFRNVAWPTWPASLYISLHTADPGDTGASEVVVGTHTWYARVAVTRNTSNWDAPADNGDGRQIFNNLVITFPTPTTSVTVTHWGIWDASTSGNFLYGAALSSSAALASGQSATSFADGVLGITES
jgi:hypothetical protein